MWRAVLFDLDGVLVDSYDTWFHAMNTIASDLAYPAITREAFAAGWGQGVEDDVRIHYPDHTVEEIEARLDPAYLRHLEHLSYDPHARPVVEAVRSRGLRTALVTNTPLSLARQILARGGLELDAIVGGTCTPRPKPAPDIPLLACERLGVDREHAVLVGDTAYDRDAAAAAGIRFVGLRCDGDHRMEALHELAELLDRL